VAGRLGGGGGRRGRPRPGGAGPAGQTVAWSAPRRAAGGGPGSAPGRRRAC